MTLTNDVLLLDDPGTSAALLVSMQLLWTA
jgi:hypothetical protein